MKFGAADFPKIQISLFACLLMVAAGGTLVAYALEHNRLAHRELLAASALRTQFDAKLKQVRNEESEIRQNSSLFSSLQARGIVGEEQRLDWVELLKEIRDTQRLIDLQYEIAPQRRLDPGNEGGIAFYASAMRLRFKPLHEEDLTRLLSQLRTQAKAHIRVRHCALSRLPRDAGNSAQLQADCQIDWITVRPVLAK